MQEARGAEGIATRFSTALLATERGFHQARNDWNWFKESWDQEMVRLYGDIWGYTFMGWMQNVKDDKRNDAFSMFVCNEMPCFQERCGTARPRRMSSGVAEDHSCRG